MSFDQGSQLRPATHLTLEVDSVRIETRFCLHDAMLGGGAMPPTLLERPIDQWIAGEKQVG